MAKGKLPEFDMFFDAVSMFIENVGILQNIIFSYEGSDFCTGLNFGYNGAGLLTNIATTLKFVDEK